MRDKELTEILGRLEKAATVLSKLPPEVRASAFDLLVSLINPAAEPPPLKDKPAGDKGTLVVGDAEAFFAKFNHDKPADNVKLITAYLYGRYGTEAFSLAQVRAIATQVGLTIPQRPDMTLKGSLEDGKSLYHSPGKDMYAPTVHGEAYLKKTYSVAKGTAKRPKDG